MSEIGKGARITAFAHPRAKYKNHSYGQNKIASQITRRSSGENLLAINMKFPISPGFKMAIDRFDIKSGSSYEFSALWHCSFISSGDCVRKIFAQISNLNPLIALYGLRFWIHSCRYSWFGFDDSSV